MWPYGRDVFKRYMSMNVSKMKYVMNLILYVAIWARRFQRYMSMNVFKDETYDGFDSICGHMGEMFSKIYEHECFQR